MRRVGGRVGLGFRSPLHPRAGDAASKKITTKNVEEGNLRVEEFFSIIGARKRVHRDLSRRVTFLIGEKLD